MSVVTGSTRTATQESVATTTADEDEAESVISEIVTTTVTKNPNIHIHRNIPQDCQICLASLRDVDHEYPLLCPSQPQCNSCNICFNCTSHLVKMKKTSPVPVLCPRCSMDISYTIEDTFLLRKVLKMLGGTNTTNNCNNNDNTTSTCTDKRIDLASYGNVPDSELSAAELRFKHSISVQQIDEAKNRLLQFQLDIENENSNGYGNSKISMTRTASSSNSENSFIRNTNRRRIVADIDTNGSSSSNAPPTTPRSRRAAAMNIKNENNPGISDPTAPLSSPSSSLSLSLIMKFIEFDLFNGMKDILSSAEQSFVSDLMTSGDVDKVVQASQILYELKRLHCTNNDAPSAKGRLGTGAGIGVGNSATSSATKKNTQNDAMKMSDAEKRALRMTLSIEEQMKLEDIESYIEMNPLPPMPKYVTLEADFDVYAKHGKVLKIRDDVWNGSISDAFGRAYVSTHARSNSDSFDSEYLEGGGGSFYYSHEEGGFVNGSTRESRQNRVLIYAARKQASKLGVEAGDIVTHFDGKEFFGTASELKELIHQCYLEGNNRAFAMMLNGDQSTADTLKDYKIELQKVK